MADQGTTGLKRIIKAAGYSFSGLKAAFKHEAAFRQELALFTILIPVSFWVGKTALEVAILIGSCLVVMITELLNSAVEAAIDRISDEHHILSKQAKDMGSAAVLLSFLLLGIVWGLILFDRFVR